MTWLLCVLLSLSSFGQEVDYVKWKVKDSLPSTQYLEINHKDIASLTELQLIALSNSAVTYISVKRMSASDFETLYPYLPKQVVYLEFQNSKFQEWPAQLTFPSSVSVVDMPKAEVSYIPEAFCSLQNLEKIILWGSNVGKLPTCLQDLQFLKQIDLDGVQFNIEEHAALKEIFSEQGILLSPPCNCDFEDAD